MRNRIKYYLMLLMFITVNVNANFEYSQKYITINKIDLVSKIVYYNENGKSYKNNYSMELLEDVYYNSTTEKESLSVLPLKKKYYVRLKTKVGENKKVIKPVIFYIGTIPYPF